MDLLSVAMVTVENQDFLLRALQEGVLDQVSSNLVWRCIFRKRRNKHTHFDVDVVTVAMVTMI